MFRRESDPCTDNRSGQVTRSETGLVELGRVSEETRICGYPKETRDNIFTGCKGPYVG